MGYATACEAARARSQLERNLKKIEGYLSQPDKLDVETKSGLESYLKKFQNEASVADEELTNHLKAEMAGEFASEKPSVSRVISFLSERDVVHPEHWPSVKEALGGRGFGEIELEKMRLNLIALEEDPVYLIVLWLEHRYGKRKVLDPMARRRLEVIRQRVGEGTTHSLTPFLLASVPLLYPDPDMGFLKEILAKPSRLSAEEKTRFKELYHLAMQGKRSELSAVVSKIIDAHSELMTKAKFIVM
ncbi:MAG: hypothetical protein ACE5JA_05725 [bacterium]